MDKTKSSVFSFFHCKSFQLNHGAEFMIKNPCCGLCIFWDMMKIQEKRKHLCSILTVIIFVSALHNIYLKQIWKLCFSNFNVHMDYLKLLLKWKLLCSRRGAGPSISNKFPKELIVWSRIWIARFYGTLKVETVYISGS